MPKDTTTFDLLFEDQFFAETTHPTKSFIFFKRLVDIATSLFLLPIVLMVCLVAAILNPFLNPGKLFYTQKRVGKNNELFRIYKLRTMQGGSNDTKFATEESGRITSLGKFMRDIHVDELPQIFNVLIGNMSLIGPRPEQPEFFKDYTQRIAGYSQRQSVRPGISGLAQLRWGYTDCPVGAREKLKWDIEYIRHQGFGLESRLYLGTFAYIFPRIGKHLIGLLKSNTSS